MFWFLLVRPSSKLNHVTACIDVIVYRVADVILLVKMRNITVCNNYKYVLGNHGVSIKGVFIYHSFELLYNYFYPSRHCRSLPTVVQTLNSLLGFFLAQMIGFNYSRRKSQRDNSGNGVNRHFHSK